MNTPKPAPAPNQNQKAYILGGLVVLAIGLLFVLGPTLNGANDSLPINKVAEAVMSDQIRKITVRDETNLIIEFKDGRRVSSTKEQFTDLASLLRNYGVTTEQISKLDQTVENSSGSALFLNILLSVGPLLIIGFFLWRMMRSVRTGQDQAMMFGRSRARAMRDSERPNVNFTDVAGVEEAKNDLKEIVEFLKEPDKFTQLGARIPKGVLMIGPPGTGKTLLARAVAGEAGVPFFSISGSEFVEMFVGVGASRVRDLFERAKAESPAIVFVDEIDAVGRQRGAGLGGGHDEREQTLNQILVEMDGFDNTTNVIVIAATNRADVLDAALLRPGRFDRKVILDRPDKVGRRAIFEVHTRGKPLTSDVDLDVLAKITPGFAGADIENMVNEAAILAARRNKKAIAMREMQESMERVVAGPERKSRLVRAEERRVIAYHEAGHAVVTHHLKHADPVHKITIVPRGQALGYMMPLPQDDQFLQTKMFFEDNIVGLLGGRAAEELTFESVTTGAANDLQRCTSLARQMITRYGMSDELGLRTFGEPEGAIFLGRELVERRDYSEDAASAIDQEVRSIIESAYDRAKSLLTANHDKLVRLAEALLEHETVDREMFENLMMQPQPVA